jgi:hypothetical protein
MSLGDGYMLKWIGLVLIPASVAVLVVALRGADGVPAPAVSAEFAQSAVWDDGQAEFSVYDGVGKFEGRERNFEAKIIVVKEDFVRDLLVKSDEGPVPGETFTVLKMNYLHDVPTGIYAFHQMVSVFFERESLRPVKLAMSSTEGCGISYLVAKLKGDVLEHVSHSYWDNEADRNLEIPWPEEAVFYDSLPLWLRGLDLGRPARYVISLLPSQISSRVGNPGVIPATIDIAGRPASGGTDKQALAVELNMGGKVDRLWFRADAPRVLTRWEKSNGTTLVLRKTMRLSYWENTAPEDAQLLR